MNTVAQRASSTEHLIVGRLEADFQVKPESFFVEMGVLPMPRLILNPNPKTRLRGTGVADGHLRGHRDRGIRLDAKRALSKASTGVRLRGTAIKARTRHH